MDNQSPIIQTQPSNSQNDIVEDGYLVSEMIDPKDISQEQIASDLAALNSAGKITVAAEETADVEPVAVMDETKSQVTAALELKNPFRGE